MITEHRSSYDHPDIEQEILGIGLVKQTGNLDEDPHEQVVGKQRRGDGTPLGHQARQQYIRHGHCIPGPLKHF